MSQKPARRRRKSRRWRLALLVSVMAALAAAGAGRAFLADDSPTIGLWLTPDQQGRRFFSDGDYARAAERFRDPLWKGVAYYRAGNFDAAVQQFARSDTADGCFDLGNAYARAGQLEQAVTSYEDALRRRPGDRAASENRDLVRSLIEQGKVAEKKKDERPLQGQPPTFNPDEIKVDDTGKQGKKGDVAHIELTADQVHDVWMRRLQTTPSDFLRLKFAAQAEQSRQAEGGRRKAANEQAPEGRRGSRSPAVSK
jgi:Ca-activated chloride channel homolog